MVLMAAEMEVPEMLEIMEVQMVEMEDKLVSQLSLAM